MLKKILTTTLLISALAPAWAAPSYEQLRKAGDQSLAKKDYATAIKQFEKLIYLYPARADAYNALGFACYLDNRYEKAIIQFKQALTYDPRLAPAQNNLMLAVGKRASEQTRELEFSEAINLLASTESLYPSHPQAVVLRYSRGQLEFFRGNEQEGLKAWQAVASKVPTSGSAKFIEGYKLYSQGKYPQAVTAFKAAQKKLPNEPVVRNYLALALSETGKADQALVELERAEKNNPPYIDLYLNHTAVLLRLDKLEEATAQAVKARDLRPDYASTHLRLAALYRQAGNTEGMQKELGRAWAEQGSPIVLVSGEVGKSVWVDKTYLGVSPVGAYVKPGKHTLKTATKGAAPTTGEFEVADQQVAYAALPDLKVETAGAAETVPSAKAAPNFALRDQSNRYWRSFQHFHRRPVVLLFWKVGGESNDETLRALSELGSRYGTDIGCAVIHVDTQKKNAALSQMMSLPATYARLFDDGSVTKRYGLSADQLPQVLVVDLDGYIAAQGQGVAGVGQVQQSLGQMLNK